MRRGGQRRHLAAAVALEASGVLGASAAEKLSPTPRRPPAELGTSPPSPALEVDNANDTDTDDGGEHEMNDRRASPHPPRTSATEHARQGREVFALNQHFTDTGGVGNDMGGVYSDSGVGVGGAVSNGSVVNSSASSVSSDSDLHAEALDALVLERVVEERLAEAEARHARELAALRGAFEFQLFDAQDDMDSALARLEDAHAQQLWALELRRAAEQNSAAILIAVGARRAAELLATRYLFKWLRFRMAALRHHVEMLEQQRHTAAAMAEEGEVDNGLRRRAEAQSRTLPSSSSSGLVCHLFSCVTGALASIGRAFLHAGVVRSASRVCCRSSGGNGRARRDEDDRDASSDPDDHPGRLAARQRFATRRKSVVYKSYV